MEILVGIVIGGLIAYIIFWAIKNTAEKEAAKHKQSEVNIEPEETITETLDRMLAEASDDVHNEIEDVAEEESETQYRILYYKDTYTSKPKWLQYQDEEGVWRCVITEVSGKVCGPESGPSSMSNASSISHMSCYEGRENELRRFAKQWPYIHKYFEYLDGLHKKYLQDKEDEQAKNGEVENL